jgi:hypothetical protein
MAKVPVTVALVGLSWWTFGDLKLEGEGPHELEADAELLDAIVCAHAAGSLAIQAPKKEIAALLEASSVESQAESEKKLAAAQKAEA